MTSVGFVGIRNTTNRLTNRINAKLDEEKADIIYVRKDAPSKMRSAYQLITSWNRTTDSTPLGNTTVANSGEWKCVDDTFFDDHMQANGKFLVPRLGFYKVSHHVIFTINAANVSCSTSINNGLLLAPGVGVVGQARLGDSGPANEEISLSLTSIVNVTGTGNDSEIWVNVLGSFNVVTVASTGTDFGQTRKDTELIIEEL